MQKKSDIIIVYCGIQIYFRKVLAEKRKELEESGMKKLKSQQLVCSICGKSVAAEELTEHSKNCRRKMELTKELMKLNKSIEEDVFKASRYFRFINSKAHSAK